MTSIKDMLPDNGFEIVKNMQVRCNRCGHINYLNWKGASEESFSEEADMGTRTEYTFTLEEECESCGKSFSCIIRATEYPPGGVEGIPILKCINCVSIDKGMTPVEYIVRDYDTFLDSPYIPEIVVPGRQISRQEMGIILVNGKALVCNEARDSDRLSSFSIKIPAHQELLEILVDETGTIHFDENGAVLAAFLSIDPKRAALRLLGKVAEAVIVRQCASDELINKKWLDIARRGYTRRETARQFMAIGTGLQSTKRMYPHKYNPSDSQRDINWMTKNGNVANVKGSNTISGIQAGLQVKVSTDGVNYVQRALIDNRYEVPVVYFPVNNDFDRIVGNLERRAQNRTIKPIIVGKDFVDAREVDRGAFNTVAYDYLPLIHDLYSGKLSADRFVKEASGSQPLQNAVLANTLEHRASKMLLIR